jgi:small-conductance mechanosensitive channel
MSAAALLPFLNLAGASGLVETEGVDLDDVLIAALVGALTIIAAQVVNWAIRRWLARPQSGSQEIVALAARLARWAVIIVGASWALSFVGVSLGWLGLTVVAALVVIVMMLRPQLEGLAAAVVVTTRPAFGVGDEIEVLDYTGEVLEITARSVVLRLRNGQRVHIPNKTVLSEVVTVISTEHPRRTEITFEVNEREDLDRLERLSLAAISPLPGVAGEPTPALRARDLGGGAVTVAIRFWHDSRISSEIETTHQVVRRLAQLYAAEGISTDVERVLVTLSSVRRDLGG